MRWTLARGLLRGNLVSHKEQQVAAISTNAISEQAHQTPSRPLSSAPLPQKTTDITDNRINIKTPVPGIFSFFVKSISRNFREVDFTKKSISKLQYQVYSLLDNAPNYLVGCVIQKRYIIILFVVLVLQIDLKF